MVCPADGLSEAGAPAPGSGEGPASAQFQVLEGGPRGRSVREAYLLFGRALWILAGFQRAGLRRRRWLGDAARRVCRGLLVACVLGVAGASAAPRDAWVVLSGGGTPTTNNYSQYLQARALNRWLRQQVPADAVWTFFGAGNVPGKPVRLADTRRQVEEDGVLLESWLSGELDGNRPATRAEVLGALRREILPRVADGGTLFLFVGDHGELSEREPRESQIVLWQLEPAPLTPRGWLTNPAQVLGVRELRDVLANGLGRGRVVFCITCCHSGGFHFLGEEETARPEPAWLRSGGAPLALAAPPPPRIAGFTATTAADPAAGCVAYLDSRTWVGSERFLPEALLGIDLVTGARRELPRDTLAEAFDAAMEVNVTIDQPHGTAEAFLETQARMIETLVSADLTPVAADALRQFRAVADGASVAVDDPELRRREGRYRAWASGLAAEFPEIAETLERGRFADLATLGASPAPPPERSRAERRAERELRRAWTDVIRPAWRRALEARSVPGAGDIEAGFERHLIALEESAREPLFMPGDRAAVQEELYWHSGAAEAAPDAARVRTLARWEARRERAILAWAADASSARVREAARSWRRAHETLAPTEDDLLDPPPLREAALRVMRGRRVLAAWTFLRAVGDEARLERTRALLALERTPVLPPSDRR